MDTDEFVSKVYSQGRVLFRPMPWRDDTRPYYVLVSELMLQQTQVARVIPKFQQFIERFPDEGSLSAAPLSEVLLMWQGLGYNRRAKYLHEAAKMIVRDGMFPSSQTDLTKLPGVGLNTAGAIAAYSFNQPAIFIETNIRTVYIYHFFASHDAVNDRMIREQLERTIDQVHPREFYWALMDYGTWLKSQGTHNINQSVHYKKQAPLSGSLREMRGIILRELTKNRASIELLRRKYAADERFERALRGLIHDGLVEV